MCRLFVGLRVTTPCNHCIKSLCTDLNVTEHFSVSQPELIQAQCADATKCSLVKLEVQRLRDVLVHKVAPQGGTEMKGDCRFTTASVGRARG